VHKTLTLYSFIILFAHLLSGQDIHFSQYDASPHQLNPAMMGAFHGAYRVVLNNKDQWSSIGVPYRTNAVALDFGIPFKYNLMGLGISGYQDRAGRGGLNTSVASFSAAYHFALGYDGTNDISIGARVSYVQRSVSIFNFSFPDQYDGNYNFDQSANTNEDFNAPSYNYLNAAFGMHWYYTPDDLPHFFAGFTLRNLTQPQDAFFEPDIQRSIGGLLHGGTTFFIDKKLRLYPKFNYTFQGSSKSLIVGADIEKYKVKSAVEKASIFAGVYYRIGDAFILLGGADISNIRFALSYDFTVSSLSPANNNMGGAELSFIYKGLFKTKKGYKCPKFDPTF